MSKKEDWKYMSENISPLAAFFHAVMNRLRLRLTPEEITDLLEECDVDSENESIGADTTSTPGQTPI